MAETRLIGRLEEAWTERSVHLNSCADDLTRQHHINLGYLCALCVSVVNHEPR